MTTLTLKQLEEERKNHIFSEWNENWYEKLNQINETIKLLKYKSYRELCQWLIEIK